MIHPFEFPLPPAVSKGKSVSSYNPTPTPPTTPLLSSSSQFDYASHFGNNELAKQAQSTNHRFITFVRRTFKELVRIGNQLMELYQECCHTLGADQGKVVFEQWLSSDEFGGSRYLADAAMTLAPWYFNLPVSLQRLVAKKANSWSIAALKQLPKLTHEMVEQLVRMGKQTARSIKCVVATTQPVSASKNQKLATKEQNSGSPIEQKAEGSPFEQGTKFPTTKAATVSQAKLYTEEEVKQKITEAIANYSTAQKEEELARLIEIREAALAQAKAEIAAAHRVKQQHEKTATELRYQVEQLQQQLATTQELVAENQRLQQRIEDLEKVLADAHDNRWGNTFTTQAAKVVNKQLKAQLEPLMQQLDEKTALVAELSAQLDTLQQKAVQVEKLSAQLEQYQRLALPLTSEQLFVGARVKVLSSVEGWTGYIGEVVERQRSSSGTHDWWVLLDEVRAQGQCTRILFKAGQLTFNLEAPVVPPNKSIPDTAPLESLNGSITQEFGEAAEVLGIPGWSYRGYRSTRGDLYTRLSEALCAFVKDLAFNPELHPAF
ncbi:MAG TPA: hypothetical protein DD379_24740 [Cyanobacteria bacterium UBA11162]|nr:hypothetical protein [Cyanobacteria bacterium UBA11162]